MNGPIVRRIISVVLLGQTVQFTVQPSGARPTPHTCPAHENCATNIPRRLGAWMRDKQAPRGRARGGRVRGRCVAGAWQVRTPRPSAPAPGLGCRAVCHPRPRSLPPGRPSLNSEGASRGRLRPHRSKPPLPGSHFGSFHFKQNLPGGQTASQGCQSQQVLSRPRRWH